MEKKEFEKLQKLLDCEGFGDAICECKSAAEFEELLIANGLELKDNEAEEIYNGILEKAESGELSEDDLDLVAGGSILGGIAVFAIGFTVAYIVARVGWKRIKKMSKLK